MNLIRKPLKVNIASGATLGPAKIAQLNLNGEQQNFTHNFIVCTKLKQHLILGLDFAERYKISIDWDINGKIVSKIQSQEESLFFEDEKLWTTDDSFIKNINS